MPQIFCSFSLVLSEATSSDLAAHVLSSLVRLEQDLESVVRKGLITKKFLEQVVKRVTEGEVEYCMAA